MGKRFGYELGVVANCLSREGRGLTAAEISDRTRISLNKVHAIIRVNGKKYDIKKRKIKKVMPYISHSQGGIEKMCQFEVYQYYV